MTPSDEEYQRHVEAVESSFPHWARNDKATAQFHGKRHLLYNRVIMSNDRIVIPRSLRKRVLQLLHGAHHGVTSMGAQARNLVYWPGLSVDIETTRQLCQTCNRIAPSQPQTFTLNLTAPSTPIEQIVADYFKRKGKHYLVTLDQLSGWANVTRAQPGSPNSGARGLISALRLLFQDKGVPEEIASDGGREFTSAETQDFLRT